jgi:hypothetical protein
MQGWGEDAPASKYSEVAESPTQPPLIKVGPIPFNDNHSYLTITDFVLSLNSTTPLPIHPSIPL